MKYRNILFLFFIFTSIATFANDFWFDIVPLSELLQKNRSIQYQKCFSPFSFSYKNFPLSINPAIHPNQGTFQETFVLTIPNGQVQGYGMVLVDNQYIEEFIWKGFLHNLQEVQKFNYDQIYDIDARVAIIGQPAFTNYFHWITEILARLALLEMSGVQYDYLYVPCCSDFMLDSLKLWGIDPNKIIVGQSHLCLNVREIILPSLVSNISFGTCLFSCYVQPHLIAYVKNKLLNAAKQYKSTVVLHPKIFISRKDAPQRKILNEDEVFALFKQQGFIRYELNGMSIVDQILLFNQADVVVSAQGTGLANCLFCKPGTKIIELFQGLNDCTFWYLAQNLDLDYTPIKTTTFLTDYHQAWSTDTYIPLLIIKSIIQNL